MAENHQNPVKTAAAFILKDSAPVQGKLPKVTGIDFNDFAGRDISVVDLVNGMEHMGFQAGEVAKAVKTIENMRWWRSPTDPAARTTVFLGFTSNLVSSGLRATLRYLVQHRHVSCIVTTAGGIEEDLIKCLAPTYISPQGFSADGATLRAEGMNRIGNLIVPNLNYQRFEEWIVPILDRMYAEQEITDHLPPGFEGKVKWTPSRVIERLGMEIDNEESICYWAAKNKIPIFSPALTDGSFGDMLTFHTYKTSPGHLVIDIAEDIRRLSDIARGAVRAGMIVLGGGLVKHHIANACLWRNGADYAVYINTAQEFDGSDAGARPDEAVSWGKIKSGDEGAAETVKVFAEATAVFPLIVAASFAKMYFTGEPPGQAAVAEKAESEDEESLTTS